MLRSFNTVLPLSAGDPIRPPRWIIVILIWCKSNMLSLSVVPADLQLRKRTALEAPKKFVYLFLRLPRGRLPNGLFSSQQQTWMHYWCGYVFIYFWFILVNWLSQGCTFLIGEQLQRCAVYLLHCFCHVFFLFLWISALKNVEELCLFWTGSQWMTPFFHLDFSQPSHGILQGSLVN